MGIKRNCKKQGVALVLILIVLASLAVVIASTMKVLIGSDTKFSHNRNAKGGSTAVTTGKFFCYKKCDEDGSNCKLYQKRVEYKADGSRSLLENSDTPAANNKCEFTIPNGAKGYEVLIVAGGGAGAGSSYEVRYTELNCGSKNNPNNKLTDIQKDECDEAGKIVSDKLDDNDIEYKIMNPVYRVYPGQPGVAGQAMPLILKGSIYGSNGTKSITIAPGDIGEGGKIDGSGKALRGGRTNFIYWSKNSSNTYTKVTHYATGGNGGEKLSSPPVFKQSRELEHIKGQEGAIPDNFRRIPSEFTINNLHAGYIDKDGSAKNANYFGSSGASGEIGDLRTDLFVACKHIKTIKGDFDMVESNHYSQNELCRTSESKNGSYGAPGAILISW